MFKRILVIATLVCALPAMANAWSLNTWVKSGGGTISSPNKAGQTVADGSVFGSYTTPHVPLTSTATPAPGYTISKTTCNGVTGTSATCTSSNTNTPANFFASFKASTVSVTANCGAGASVSPRSLSNIYYGQTALAAIKFVFTPKAGFAVGPIGGAGGFTVSAPNATTGAVSVTIPKGFVFTSAVALSANPTSTSPVANAGAPQTVVPNTPVTLNGAACTGTITTYTWAQTSGPAVTLTPATSNATFTPTVAGAYTFKLTVTGGSSAFTTITVTNSLAAAAKNACVKCHIANGVGVAPANVYSNWSSSAHKANLITCTTCHIGADTGGHPGVTVTSAACEGCHSAALSTTTHPVAITASKCLVCHDSHDPAAGIANLGQAPAHPAVTLYTFEEIGIQMAGGAKVPVQVDANGKGMPYSPKQTCGTAGCHIKNGVDYTYDKISDHAFHSGQGKSEMDDSADGKFRATKNKPWLQSTAMVGKW